MKYAIVIPDGAADRPQEALGGKTPLEAAATPNMDRIARAGITGTLRTIPKGFQPGSDVAVMSIVGLDPETYYTGRAPLEAAGVGIELAEGDLAARCNLVTIADGRMADYSAGHIASEEAAAIIENLQQTLGGEGLEFHAGKSYRNLLVMRGGGDLQVETMPPHDIAGKEIGPYLPAGRDAEVFMGLMEKSHAVLAAHDVNVRRRAAGRPEATGIWLWGQGSVARFPDFTRNYGRRAAFITAVDLVAGICLLCGWQRIVVPGATGYYDTDYRGKAAAALEGLSACELVLVHVEAPDEASHNMDLEKKIRTIENVDREVVGPILEAGEGFGGFRMLVMADHYTLVSSGAHSGEPVPFAICGTGIEPAGAGGFGEAEAAGGVRLEHGPELMGTFLGKAG